MLDNKSLEVVSDGKKYVRFSLTAIGAVSSIVSIVLFFSGFVFGYTAFKADLNVVTQQLVDVRVDNKALQERVGTISQALVDDRQAMTNRLTNLEAEIKYISQGIAELKLANIPKR